MTEVVKTFALLLLKVPGFARETVEGYQGSPSDPDGQMEWTLAGVSKELREFSSKAGPGQSSPLKEWSLYALALLVHEESLQERGGEQAKGKAQRVAFDLLAYHQCDCKALVHRSMNLYLQVQQKQ
jgi:hypothetical protein